MDSTDSALAISADWAVRLRAMCELDGGPDSMTATWDGVTVHVTADRVRLVTSAGTSNLDLDAMRYEVVAMNRQREPHGADSSSPLDKDR